MKLNIGCGPSRIEGFVNIDREPMAEPDVVADIGADVWPFPDNSVTQVMASHILEHLTTDQFFHCLKEMHRVCAPDAQINVIVPHPRHWLYLSDPTHQRPVLPSTLMLFSKEQNKECTPFWKYAGVDFFVDPRVAFYRDPAWNDCPAEEFFAAEKKYNNVVTEIHILMRAVK